MGKRGIGHQVEGILQINPGTPMEMREIKETPGKTETPLHSTPTTSIYNRLDRLQQLADLEAQIENELKPTMPSKTGGKKFPVRRNINILNRIRNTRTHAKKLLLEESRVKRELEEIKRAQLEAQVEAENAIECAANEANININPPILDLGQSPKLNHTYPDKQDQDIMFKKIDSNATEIKTLE